MNWPIDVFEGSLSDVAFVRRLDAGVSSASDEIAEAIAAEIARKNDRGYYRNWWS